MGGVRLALRGVGGDSGGRAGGQGSLNRGIGPDNPPPAPTAALWLKDTQMTLQLCRKIRAFDEKASRLFCGRRLGEGGRGAQQHVLTLLSASESSPSPARSPVLCPTNYKGVVRRSEAEVDF